MRKTFSKCALDGVLGLFTMIKILMLIPLQLITISLLTDSAFSYQILARSWRRSHNQSPKILFGRPPKRPFLSPYAPEAGDTKVARFVLSRANFISSSTSFKLSLSLDGDSTRSTDGGSIISNVTSCLCSIIPKKDKYSLFRKQELLVSLTVLAYILQINVLKKQSMNSGDETLMNAGVKKDDVNVSLSLDKEKDGGAVVGTMFIDKVSVGNGSDTESNQITKDGVLPIIPDENPKIGLQSLGRSKEANAIDTRDDNLESSSSNVSMKPIRESTEVKQLLKEKNDGEAYNDKDESVLATSSIHAQDATELEQSDAEENGINNELRHSDCLKSVSRSLKETAGLEQANADGDPHFSDFPSFFTPDMQKINPLIKIFKNERLQHDTNESGTEDVFLSPENALTEEVTTHLECEKGDKKLTKDEHLLRDMKESVTNDVSISPEKSLLEEVVALSQSDKKSKEPLVNESMLRDKPELATKKSSPSLESFFMEEIVTISSDKGNKELKSENLQFTTLVESTGPFRDKRLFPVFVSGFEIVMKNNRRLLSETKKTETGTSSTSPETAFVREIVTFSHSDKESKELLKSESVLHDTKELVRENLSLSAVDEVATFSSDKEGKSQLENKHSQFTTLVESTGPFRDKRLFPVFVSGFKIARKYNRRLLSETKDTEKGTSSISPEPTFAKEIVTFSKSDKESKESLKNESVLRDTKEMVGEDLSLSAEKVFVDDIDDLGERAFAILCDLGMVDVSPDPGNSDYDHAYDDEYCT